MLGSNLTKTTRQRQIFGQSETFLTVLEIEAGAGLHVMAINMESLWATGTITFGMFQFLSKLSLIQSYILDMLRSTRSARSFAYIDWTFRWAHPLFSAFNPRSLLRTRPPIATFPSPVISSFRINSRSSSRSAPWTSNRMIRKAILSCLICNVMEWLRVWLPLSSTATHWILLMLALPLTPLWPTNRTRKSLEILTPFTSTLTSPILHLSVLLSPTECGQVLQPAAMLKV